MAFVSKHPTVVILCLGFLLMIGFSLIVEGFGYHLPKGYLSAAIGFSILIEAANQIGHRNRERAVTSGDLRDRTAEAVLRLLGGKRGEVQLGGAADAIAERTAEKQLFAPEEKDMIAGVLTLAERPVISIMTPRTEIDWLDLEDDEATLKVKIVELGHSRFPLVRGSLDDFVGIALAKDLMRDLLGSGTIDLERSLRQPLVVHESVTALRLMEQLRGSTLQMAVVVDEYGSIEGIATPTDILDAIAGDFVDDNEEAVTAERPEDGSWLVDGWIDVRRAFNIVRANLSDAADRYSTLAGYILWQLGHLPSEGQRVAAGDYEFEIVKMDERAIDKVRIRQRKAIA